VYVSHHQVASRLLGIKPGQHATIAGVAVERLPAGEGRAPKGGTFRVGGGEEMRLLRAMDELVRLVGLEPWAGGGYDGDDS
jgi:hypothetical protein